MDEIRFIKTRRRGGDMQVTVCLGARPIADYPIPSEREQMRRAFRVMLNTSSDRLRSRAARVIGRGQGVWRRNKMACRVLRHWCGPNTKENKDLQNARTAASVLHSERH